MGWGGGTLSCSYIRISLAHFCSSKFWISIFLWFSEKWIFLGYKKNLLLFWCLRKAEPFLGVILIHFRLTLKVKVQDRNIFGFAKISNIFGVCLISFFFFFLVNSRCWVQSSLSIKEKMSLTPCPFLWPWYSWPFFFFCGGGVLWYFHIYVGLGIFFYFFLGGGGGVGGWVQDFEF